MIKSINMNEVIIFKCILTREYIESLYTNTAQFLLTQYFNITRNIVSKHHSSFAHLYLFLFQRVFLYKYPIKFVYDQ